MMSLHADKEGKVYNSIKLRVSMAEALLHLAVLAWFAFGSFSYKTTLFLEFHFVNPYIQYLIYISILGLVMTLVTLPLDYYSEFMVEHHFNLSHQTVEAWAMEKAKSVLLSVVIGLPVAFAFYYLIRLTGPYWWIYFSLVLFFFTVILAQLAPVLIFPLFYKFTPLEEGEVSDRIHELLQRERVNIMGIYSFDLSKNTRKANAGFSGIGQSRRIILSDTLLKEFSSQEIAVIFAHELGHYTRKHILKNLVVSAIIIFASFYICGQLYRMTIGGMGFVSLDSIAAFPVLFFYLAIFGMIILPMTNMISRYFEREADNYALTMTSDATSFISGMEKLAEINLADTTPHPLIETLFYSHPSLARRIEAAIRFGKTDLSEGRSA